MNNYIQNFMGFEGRLNRQPFWLGIIGLIVAYIVVGFIVGMIFGVNPVAMVQTAFESTGDTEAMAQLALDATRSGGWAGLITLIILAYPGMSLWIKRAHDRDQGPNLIYALYVLLALQYLLQGLGVTMTISNFGGVSVPTMSTMGWVLSVATGLLGLYLLITLGFLKGTEGPNQYGPDPLGGGELSGDAA